MVTNNQKLVFCIEETQKMFDAIEKETNWDWMDVSIEMSHRLGNPHYETLIVKLGSAPGSVELDTSSFENWNKQLEEEIELEPTTELELDLLYQAICKFKENQNVNLKEYLTKEWLNYKEEWSKGSTPEELLNYTQPTVGDLECLVQRMEDVDFDTTLNQALKVFNYIK